MLTVASTTATSPSQSSSVAVGAAGDDDRADQDHAVDGVRAGHQRRVQGRRDLRDDLEADEDAEDEDREQRRCRPSGAHLHASRAGRTAPAVVRDPAAGDDLVVEVQGTTPSLIMSSSRSATVARVEPAARRPASATARSRRPTPWRRRSTTSSPATEPSTLPPDSAARSTTTDPGRIASTIARVTSSGAGRPGTAAVVMTASAAATYGVEQLALALRPGPRSSRGRTRRRPRAPRGRARRTWRPSSAPRRPRRRARRRPRRPRRAAWPSRSPAGRRRRRRARAPCAGGTVPAAVMSSGKNLGSRSAATSAQR